MWLWATHLTPLEPFQLKDSFGAVALEEHFALAKHSRLEDRDRRDSGVLHHGDYYWAHPCLFLALVRCLER